MGINCAHGLCLIGFQCHGIIYKQFKCTLSMYNVSPQLALMGGRGRLGMQTVLAVNCRLDSEIGRGHSFIQGGGGFCPCTDYTYKDQQWTSVFWTSSKSWANQHTKPLSIKLRQLGKMPTCPFQFQYQPPIPFRFMLLIKI